MDLARTLELVRLRGDAGFTEASVALFGGVEPELLDLARRILAGVVPGQPLEADTGVDAVVEAVEREVEWYRERAPDFALDVIVNGTPPRSSRLRPSFLSAFGDGPDELPRGAV